MTHPATDVVEREAIARIIDPKPFRTVEERDADIRSSMPMSVSGTETAIASLARDNHDADEPRRDEALAKADAIIALRLSTRAVEDEREACAALAESMPARICWAIDGVKRRMRPTTRADIASAIRARTTDVREKKIESFLLGFHAKGLDALPEYVREFARLSSTELVEALEQVRGEMRVAINIVKRGTEQNIAISYVEEWLAALSSAGGAG